MNTQQTLRVGIAANYPPLAYKRGGKLIGMEVDFAKNLAQELNKKIEIVETSWQDLIPTLQSGQIDIIMAGMSITPERRQKVAFTNSFMSVSQMLLVRKRELGQFRKPGNNYYINAHFKIGVVKDTTGEKLVHKHLPNYRVKTYKNIDNAIQDLRQGLIDCFLHDSPTIWHYSNNRDSQITGIYWKFSNEKIAWAVNRKNVYLLNRINSVLDRWRTSGKSAKIISKWIPFRINYK